MHSICYFFLFPFSTWVILIKKIDLEYIAQITQNYTQQLSRHMETNVALSSWISPFHSSLARRRLYMHRKVNECCQVCTHRLHHSVSWAWGSAARDGMQNSIPDLQSCFLSSPLLTTRPGFFLNSSTLWLKPGLTHCR